MSFHSPFTYFCCQHGAESIIKQQLCEPAGPFRLSFSTPGFVTLKSTMAISPWSRAIPESPWIRSAGHAFRRMEGVDARSMIAEIFGEYGSLDWQQVHVWQRDSASPGWKGFEPGPNPLVHEIAGQIQNHLQSIGDSRADSIHLAHTPAEAFPEAAAKALGLEETSTLPPLPDTAPTIVEPTSPSPIRFLDIVLVEPHRWWIGSHLAERIEQTWPGGVYPVVAPENMISRAYLKIAEALAWAQLPMNAGDAFVEIGSAPGGACQRLLELGFRVTGIDPAEMDPLVAEHPRFTHWRARSLEVKRREFSKFRWLACDANVAPNYTLDTVEAIVTYPTSNFQGLVLTMKLSDWDQASKMEEHVARVRTWGFPFIKTRQLAYSRTEYCLVASRVGSV